MCVVGPFLLHFSFFHLALAAGISAFKAYNAEPTNSRALYVGLGVE